MPCFFACAIFAVAEDSLVTNVGGKEIPPFFTASAVGACTCFAGIGTEATALLGRAAAMGFGFSFSIAVEAGCEAASATRSAAGSNFRRFAAICRFFHSTRVCEPFWIGRDVRFFTSGTICPRRCTT